MATIPITPGNNLFQGGRSQVETVQGGQSYLSFRSEITTDTFEFGFSGASQQANTFGAPRAMFFNNNDNANEVAVVVSISGQSFVIPPRSSGYYNLDATSSSSVSITSVGAVPGSYYSLTFYNYTKAPVVWYADGASGSTPVTIADGADVALGSTTDPLENDPTQPATVTALLKGLLDQILDVVTNTGNLTGLTTNTNPYLYDNITGAATTVVKGTPGVIAGISINTGAAGTATIYDNTSGAGSIIAIVDTTALGYVNFAGGNGIEAAIGITVVTSAASDVTVFYR